MSDLPDIADFNLWGATDDVMTFTYELWARRLRDLYNAVKGQRRLQLKGIRQGASGFDGLRGVHLVSEAWGAIQACEAIVPELMVCESDLHLIRAAAEEDALREFLAMNRLGEVVVNAA